MNILNDLMNDVCRAIDVKNKYIIKDKNGKDMIFYWLSNAHIGNPTVNLGYEVEDGYDIIFDVETHNINLMKKYFEDNQIKVELK